MIRAHAISWSTAGCQLLQKVALSIQPGKVLAILGPNGAGKSTLFKVLSRENPLQQGNILIDGIPMEATPLDVFSRKFAILRQTVVANFPLQVREVVAFGRLPHQKTTTRSTNRDIVAAAMQATGTHIFADRDIRSLSGGEQQRVQLARVLAQIWQPPADGSSRYLLLDEPTSSLDHAQQHACMHVVQKWAQRGVGVAVILHDINLALQYADELLFLKSGQVAAHGPVAEVLSTDLLKSIYGVHCQLCHPPEGLCPFVQFQQPEQI